MTDDTSRLEDDLRVTRARMGNRLTELQEHLTPGQLLDDVLAYFRDSGGADFGRNLMTSVRTNPTCGHHRHWLSLAHGLRLRRDSGQ
jgi:Protein of unknown function (DUF3618).